MFRFLIFLLFFVVRVFSSGMEPLNILNFRAVNGAFDIVRQNDTVFVATGGGLAQFQYSSGNFISLYHSHEQFPEISLTALEADDGGIWIGSENGYLYYRQKGRRQKIYDDLFAVKSKINKIKSHGNYLIIAHERGVSVFDKKSGKILSTKRNFAGLPNSSANLIIINGTTLYVAVNSDGKSGVVSLNEFEKYLGDTRFDENSPFSASVPWKIEQTNDIFTIKGSNYKLEFDGQALRKINNSGNEVKTYEFGSDINFVKFIDGKIAVGTEYDYAYFLNENLEFSKQFTLHGLVNNTSIAKLFVDGENSLWILPWVDGRRFFWWNRVEKITKKQEFSGYNAITPNFGVMGYHNDFTGVAQYNENTMFFGNSFDYMKNYNMKTDTWGHWVFDTEKFSNYFRFEPIWTEHTWDVKIDALIKDGNGVVWGTYYRDKKPTETPVIFAFDPDRNNFRFLLHGFPGIFGFPNRFAMLGNGDLVLGFEGRGDLWLIDRSKNPFDENINSMDYLKDTVINNNITKTLSATGAGNVFVGTSGIPVIYAYDNNLKRLKKFTIENLPERFNANTNDIVLEYSEELWSEFENQTRIRSVFWIANSRVGVERVVIDEYQSLGSIDSIVYDTEQTVFALSQLNGGINIDALALAIDSAQNLLWIGGDKGLTRIRLPQRVSVSSSAKNDYIFPNPFVLSRHKSLSIPAPQNSFVDIYTVSGKLVKHINENSAERTRTIDGSFMYKWRIPQNFAPGTYIVSVKSLEGDKISRGNTKQYKLVIIK